MRFLFALRHAAYMRNFESTLRLLAERGHEVVLALGQSGKRALRPSERHLRQLAAELPGLVVENGVEQTAVTEDEKLARRLRSWLDFMRCFDEGFEEAEPLRERQAKLVSPKAIEVTRAAAADPAVLDALRASVTALESVLPVPAEVMRYVERHAPDAVIVSPLIDKGAPQVVYLRAARRLGVSCGLCLASWDNLTTAGLVHGAPDLLTVWNDLLLEEAVRLHGVPRERIAVVGAPLYDRWFETRPSMSREEICARAGLPDDRPYILYVASAAQIAPAEERWVLRWAKRIRAAAPAELARASILVRPHPRSPFDTDHEALRGLDALPGVSIHPRLPDLVADPAAHQEYFDAIRHAAAVVGVNTSAMIEAAIVGRGVHVLLSKRFRDAHQGRPHFEHLVSAGGGLLRTSETIADHVEGLARAIRGEDADDCRERANRFLHAFVRPHGLGTAATPLLVEALESLPGMRRNQPAPQRSAGGRAAEFAELERMISPPALQKRRRLALKRRAEQARKTVGISAP